MDKRKEKDLVLPSQQREDYLVVSNENNISFKMINNWSNRFIFEMIKNKLSLLRKKFCLLFFAELF